MIQAERHRPAQLGVIERRRCAVDEQGARQVGREHIADRLRRLVLEVLQQRDCHAEDLIETAGGEPQDAGRQARDDRPVDAIEVGPARFPVLRVPGDSDPLVWPEFNEFERASANWMGAHVAR